MTVEHSRFNMQARASPALRTHLFLNLELADSIEEAEILSALIESKRIISPDSALLVKRYARRLDTILKSKRDKLNEQSLRVIFECLIELFDCIDDAEDLEFIAFNLHCCFENVDRYDFNPDDTPIQLPVEIHIKAMESCRKKLNQIQNNERTTQHIINALPYITNHKDLSIDQQMEIIPLIQTHAESEYAKIRGFRHCATLEYSTSYFRSTAVDNILQYVTDNHAHRTVRDTAISCFPFHPDYLNIDQELRQRVVRVLFNLVKDTTERRSARVSAAESLSSWVQCQEKQQTWLTDEQRNLIDELIGLLKYSDSSSVRKAIGLVG